MNKVKTTISVVFSLSVLTFSISVSLMHSNKTVVSTNATDYEITLNNTKRISNETSSYTSEQDASITTGNNNQITIKTSNVLKFDSGWQTIMPNGYFYNPVTNVGHHNKISGIQSITYTSDTNNSLVLYYGYSINNTEIIYSLKETITANVKYIFSSNHPSYFYLENDGDNPININSFSIEYSCNEEQYPYQDLNVLMIGNSFADDTIYYAERVAQSYGINLNIYNSYIAGCTIDQHYSNLSSNATDYSMRSMNGDQWNYVDDISLSEILLSHTWDIITFQQASAEVGRSTSYSNLNNLVNLVKTTIGYTPRMMWHETWAYDADYHDRYDYFSYFGNDQIAMFNAIVDCYETQVEPLGIFEKIIPAGTAVQNLRSSFMDDTFTRDGKHMSSVHGRYLLSLDFLSSVYGVDLSKSPCTYIPEGVNSSFMPVLVESIQNAIKDPLSITNSLFTTPEIASYDLSNYTEIDAGLVGCSFWNSTDASNYNKRIQNTAGSSNLYVSTKRFTPETLPVGSIVSIAEGFGVRPEAWLSDAQQSSRPAETYQNVIQIDSAFWGSYAYRAFNIFKAGKTPLSGEYIGEQFDEIFDRFHVYVPNASLGDLKAKTYNNSYNADKLVMKSALYNIDSFERLHLDPIIGFYKCDSYYDLRNSYSDDTAKKFVCTRPFYSANNDLPENTIIIVDSGYQWRSDCWGAYNTYSPRPGNVSTQITVLDSSFWTGFRRRTFNVSSTSSSYVGQNALAFMDHMRIYVPTTDDIYLEQEDTVTMTALGYATLNSMATSIYGKSSIPILITLHGDDVDKVDVLVDGSDALASHYSYNKTSGNLSIQTSGDARGYTYGTISGVVDRDAGTISSISISGSMKSFVTNNGSVTAREIYHDRCNYSTNAASQNVWQRWYMSGSWTANSGIQDWTTANNVYRLDNDYSMGLRIANNSFGQTRFTLKSDLNNGAGLDIKGISIWLFNPNGDVYNSIRIYLYTSASTMENGHAKPSGNYIMPLEKDSLRSNEWVNYNIGVSSTTIYNLSIFFQSTTSATTYVYLGHVSLF